MKFKLLAFVLMFAATTWAQTATQSAPSPAKPSGTKAQCACCDQTAGAKDAQGCCHHMDSKDGKPSACCSGKNGASCCGKDMQCGKADPDNKTAQSSNSKDCCGEKGCCAEGKGCCTAAKEGDKTAMACCSGNQCGMHNHDTSTGGLPK